MTNKSKEQQRKYDDWAGPKGKGSLGIGLDWANGRINAPRNG